jgi:ribosomal-protein-alanine N-acetyltransferase
MSLAIVRLSEEHLDAMEAIEKLSFPTTWGPGSFRKELEENKLSRYFVALADDVVAGYVGAWSVLDELHITTFAVDPNRRGQGIGRRLLAALLQNAVDEGVRWAVLEVRESNEAAIKVYASFGFRQVGVRKKYYENDENALVLWVGQMQQKDFRDLLRERAG